MGRAVDMRQLASDPKVWVFSTYFTEGFPYMIVRSMSSVFFTDIGMSERALGYLNFLGLPWNLKFLWAPAVDIFASKRAWLIWVQAAITLLTAGVALLCFSSAGAGAPGADNGALVWVFIVLALIAATNDIAIDGYYMEGLTDPGEQAANTGYRVMAYRLSMILARFGIILAVAEVARTFAGSNLYLAWGYGFASAALVMAAFTAFHSVALPRFEQAQHRVTTLRKTGDDFLASFSSYLEISKRRSLTALASALAAGGVAWTGLLAGAIPGVGAMPVLQAFAYALAIMLITLLAQARPLVALSLVFIIFYKIGDEIIFSMGTPFLKRYLLVSNEQLAWMSGLIGMVGSIAGTAIGGIWIKRTGLRKAIWPLTLIMNVNILAYVWLAYEQPPATTTSGLITIALVYCYEQIAAGLGNAVLIVYILRTCKPEFKAGHYAIGSAFMSVFSSIFGGMGGVIVEDVGYLGLFTTGFCASIPAMALLFVVPIKDA
jgi:MFS transporter, PAT family, beta-lactamase induction signal transducer AmpG